MNSYETALLYIARQEIQITKESGKEFKLNRKKFDPESPKHCFYGQVFDGFGSEEAMAFKESENIPYGFRIDPKDQFDKKCTALEVLCELLWSGGYRDKVFKLLDEFVIWDDEKDLKWYEI